MLFLGHSTRKGGKKKSPTKGIGQERIREVHVMFIHFASPTLHKSPDPPPLHHCSDFFFGLADVPSTAPPPPSHPKNTTPPNPPPPTNNSNLELAVAANIIIDNI